jgi:hypothetical protein
MLLSRHATRRAPERPLRTLNDGGDLNLVGAGNTQGKVAIPPLALLLHRLHQADGVTLRIVEHANLDAFHYLFRAHRPFAP